MRFLSCVGFLLFAAVAAGQESAVDSTPVEQEQTARQAEEAAKNEIAEDISVAPEADDAAIRERIESLIAVLGQRRGFHDVAVDVEAGVVFLDGFAPTEQQKNFAGEIARNVDGVVHVDNELRVDEVSPWSLKPAWAELSHLGRDGIRFLPFLLAGLLIVGLSVLIAALVRRAARSILAARDYPPILRQVLANLIAIPVLLIGAFLALRVSGLTRLALSVLGGTGLFGLVVGIAFRDIFENFLASLLISTNRPFTIGDLIEVEGHLGFVQTVTTRGTLLMTREGNHVHVPNSAVYKATLGNMTSNPNMRIEVVIGIDYDDEPSAVQAAIRDVLAKNPLVLDDPPPMVVIDELGASTVNVRCLFWLNAKENSRLKVKSRVVREIKTRLDEDGFTMPDELREMIFPKGVPVQMVESQPPEPPRELPEPECVEDAEGDMSSENDAIARQANESDVPVSGECLVDRESEAAANQTGRPVSYRQEAAKS